MKLIVAADAAEFSHAAADILVSLITAKPDATLMLPTGESPLGLYDELRHRYMIGALRTDRVRLIQLDDYLGIGPEDHRSFFRWLSELVLTPLEIPAERMIRLPGDASDPVAACHKYDEEVRAVGGIDLAVLGIGTNGHLGMNEPPTDDQAPTRVVNLSAESITSNARYWGDPDVVPRQGITAGMPLVLAARSTLLLAMGERKRDILHRALRGPVTPEVPASYLQRVPNLTVVADLAAWPDDPPGADETK